MIILGQLFSAGSGDWTYSHRDAWTAQFNVLLGL